MCFYIISGRGGCNGGYNSGHRSDVQQREEQQESNEARHDAVLILFLDVQKSGSKVSLKYASNLKIPSQQGGLLHTVIIAWTFDIRARL